MWGFLLHLNGAENMSNGAEFQSVCCEGGGSAENFLPWTIGGTKKEFYFY